MLTIEKKSNLAVIILSIYLFGLSSIAYSENEQMESDEDIMDRELMLEQAEEGERLRVASSSSVRRFHEVLNELLAEFSYDVKLGQIEGLKNISIRKVEVSEALPQTYKKYLKLLIAERIRENSKVKIISCIPCRTKTSKIIDGKIMITSPATNIANLKTVADRLGIDNFMDVILIYHTTHMVLAFQIFKVSTNEMIWARTYNSETIKSRFQKLAIDYSQVAKSRPTGEYQPEYRLLFGLGGAGIPNVGGTSDDSSMIDLQLRSTEKFDNRRSEFGMIFSLYMTISSLLNEYPIESGTGTDVSATQTEEGNEDLNIPAKAAPFSFALGIYGIYAHNFLGSVESYNEMRQGFNLGIGTLMTGGYMAPSLRGGWDVYFGRRFTMGFAGMYIAPSKILVNGDFVETKGGPGFEIVLSLNY